jgi:hypothetical protein
VLEEQSVYIQHLRYKYLAYCVIRDAIGFYFGIPKLFNQCPFEDAVSELSNQKITGLEQAKGRKLTDSEVDKCVRLTEKMMAGRLEELTEDYLYSKDVLFNDNLWLQLLDLNGSFFRDYLDSLSIDLKDELAVIPKWNTRDHSLGRPYINDDFNLASKYF